MLLVDYNTYVEAEKCFDIVNRLTLRTLVLVIYNCQSSLAIWPLELIYLSILILPCQKVKL
jgi:hypothetical protein